MIEHHKENVLGQWVPEITIAFIKVKKGRLVGNYILKVSTMGASLYMREKMVVCDEILITPTEISLPLSEQETKSETKETW